MAGSRLWMLRVVVALAYGGTGYWALQHPYVGTHISLLWLPSGIALAALLRWGTSLWPAVWVGAFTVNLFTGTPPMLLAVIATGNTLGPLLGVRMLARSGYRVTEISSANSLRFIFVGGLCAMLFSSLWGTLALALFGVFPWFVWPRAWLTWWLGDSMGVVLAGLPLLYWSKSSFEEQFNLRTGGLTLALAALNITYLLAIFLWPMTQVVALALVLPTFLLAGLLAVRAGPLMSSLVVLAMAAISAVLTARGLGPFRHSDLNFGVGLTWSFMATLSVLVTMLSTLTHEIRVREARYRHLTENSPAGVVLHRDGVITYANRKFREMMGWASQQDSIGVRWRDVVHPKYWEVVRQRIEHLETHKSTATSLEFDVLDEQRRPMRVEATGVVVDTESGPQIQSVLIDQRAKQAAQTRMELLAQVFSSAQEGIAVLDANGRIIETNPRLQQLADRSSNDLTGLEFQTLFSAPRAEGAGDQNEAWMEAAVRRGQTETVLLRSDGQRRSVRVSLSRTQGVDEGASLLLAIVVDTTELQRHREELQRLKHQSMHDALTGLPNRQVLMEELERRCTQRSAFLLCHLNLDQFKAVNRALGHNLADQVLIEVGARLSRNLRPDEMAIRTSGDNFVLLLAAAPTRDLADQALLQLLRRFKVPLVTGQRDLMVTVSAGVVSCPSDVSEPLELLRRAELALRSVKFEGGNGYSFFDDAMERSARVRSDTLTEFRQARRLGQLLLRVQPCVHLETGQLESLETQVCWQHPTRGELSPEQFSFAIQGTNEELDCGVWAIEQAIAWLNRRHELKRMVRLTIKVSTFQLLRPDFLDILKLLLGNPGKRLAHHLEFEIQDLGDRDDASAVLPVIEACRRIGVRFALGGFGSESASLVLAARLPIAALNLDAALVFDAIHSARARGIVEAASSFSRHLKLSVLAKGVESVSHARLLHDCGCQLFQGDALARPMRLEQWDEWQLRWERLQLWDDGSRNLAITSADASDAVPEAGRVLA